MPPHVRTLDVVLKKPLETIDEAFDAADVAKERDVLLTTVK